mmetsp:Transcript_30534/g.45167  ORF Transcript_30534/g.45167 Transcript_30534/m.45167 type:complete len:166 (-) Transcript_30534:295-792(-)
MNLPNELFESFPWRKQGSSVRNDESILNNMPRGKEKLSLSPSPTFTSAILSRKVHIRLTSDHVEKTRILINNDILWKEFQQQLRASGVTTNLAVQEILNEFVADRMNHFELNEQIKSKAHSSWFEDLKSMIPAPIKKINSLGSNLCLSHTSHHVKKGRRLVFPQT